MARPEPPHDPRVLRSRVPAQHAGKPLLAYLTLRFPYLSEASWRQEITAGRVTVDGAVAASNRLLGKGSQVGWLRTAAEPTVDAAINLLHRGTDYLVVAKPAHLPMHADGPFVRNTLVHLLSQAEARKVTLVHRLDRETSGVVVAALTSDAGHRLAAQFEAGTVRKTYLAVVHGELTEPRTLEAPIGRSAGSIVALRRSAAPDALAPQPAATEIEPLSQAGGYTLVSCRPRTGRTHQIRVHLEAIGHPIFGDKLYGRPDDDYLAFVQAVKHSGNPKAVEAGRPDRQLLHAWRLELVGEEGGERTTFAAPLPADLRGWCERLGLALPAEPQADRGA